MLPPYTRKRGSRIKAFIETSNVIEGGNYENLLILKTKK